MLRATATVLLCLALTNSVAGFCAQCAMKQALQAQQNNFQANNYGSNFQPSSQGNMLSFYGGDPNNYGANLGRQIAQKIQEMYASGNKFNVNSGNTFSSFPSNNNNNFGGNVEVMMPNQYGNQNTFGNQQTVNGGNMGNNFVVSQPAMPPVFPQPNKGKCPYCFGNNKKVKKA